MAPCPMPHVPSLPLTVSPPPRPAGARGADRGVPAAGGGAVRAGGLLVPVRGLELCGHHQESPGLRPHRMYASHPDIPLHTLQSPGPFPVPWILEWESHTLGGYLAENTSPQRHQGPWTPAQGRLLDPEPGLPLAHRFVKASFHYIHTQGSCQLPHHSRPSGREPCVSSSPW